MQRQFSSCECVRPVLARKFCFGNKCLSPQHVAYLAGLNSCFVKRGEMTSIFYVNSNAMLLQAVVPAAT